MTLVCLAIATVHAILVWGYVSEFWGDTGRWMHEIDRFAHGERLYLDFTWPFPPLAMWVVGGAAGLVGTGVHQLWAITCVIYAGIVVAYLRYALAVLPDDNRLVPAVAGLVLGLAFAQVGSAPLPMGMYAPAAPLGGLFLLVSIGCLVHLVQGDVRWRTAALLGASASLAVLTKQDFWVAALAAVLLGLKHVPSRHRGFLLVSAIGPALIGYVIVLLQLGLPDFVQMLGGFGHAVEFGDRGLPSGRRIAASMMALGLALGAGMVVVQPRHRRWWLLPVVLVLSAVGATLLEEGPGGLRTLRDNVQFRAFSVLLPVVVLAWLWRRRADANPTQARLAQVLLVVAVAARARRGFQGVDWYHVLLEVPAYVLAIRSVLGMERVGWQRLVAAALLPLGLYLLWTFGRGPLTDRGRLEVESVETVRGAILLRPGAAAQYRFAAAIVDSLDPTGTRPLFAFGYVGGWDYFLGRRNPTPAPHGFRLTRLSPDSILRLAASARPIVFDVPLFTTLTVPDRAAGLLQWSSPRIPSHFMRVDRPYFERLIAGCPQVATYPNDARPFLIVHDCGR